MNKSTNASQNKISFFKTTLLKSLIFAAIISGALALILFIVFTYIVIIDGSSTAGLIYMVIPILITPPFIIVFLLSQASLMLYKMIKNKTLTYGWLFFAFFEIILALWFTDQSLMFLLTLAD